MKRGMSRKVTSLLQLRLTALCLIALFALSGFPQSSVQNQGAMASGMLKAVANLDGVWKGSTVCESTSCSLVSCDGPGCSEIGEPCPSFNFCLVSPKFSIELGIENGQVSGTLRTTITSLFLRPPGAPTLTSISDISGTVSGNTMNFEGTYSVTFLSEVFGAEESWKGSIKFNGVASSDGKSINGTFSETATVSFEILGSVHEVTTLGSSGTFTLTGQPQLSVVFEEMYSNQLDANPNARGGLRIFPDKQNDPVNRRKVRVKATGPPDTTIYFRSFDVDDPSSNAAPVDPNASMGDDNRGRPKCGAFPNGSCSTSAQTDGSGIAEVEFEVTMQPGDNFKVAISTDQTYLNGVTVAGTDLFANGNKLPTDKAAVTDMLTVWRRLHIEVDSMGPVKDNKITGIIGRGSITRGRGMVLVFVGQTLENMRFQNGRITIAGVGSFPVTANLNSAVGYHIIQFQAAPNFISGNLSGRSFTLVDDDDFNNNDGTNLRGDEGENISAPDLSLMADSLDNGVCDYSRPNVFGPAYVCPVYDLMGNDDFVPFVLNVTDYTPMTLKATYDFDAVGTEASEDFWTVYLLGAYQGVPKEDADPDTEPCPDPGRQGICPTFGVVDDINGQGASVFSETIADLQRYEARRRRVFPAGCSNKAVAAHEIGHLFRGLHDDGGLMSSPCNNATSLFSESTIKKIREIMHP